MNKKRFVVLLGLLLFSCGGGVSQNVPPENEIIDYNPSKEETEDQFDFRGNYTTPELNVDGVDDESQWENATDYITFGALNQAKVKIYRGEKALYCYFVVLDEDIETVGMNNGDDVTKGDSVEIYFDFKNDGSAKPQTDDIQINIGAHGKTRIFVGANGTWGSWNGLLDYEIVLEGTLNDASDVDTGYKVELMIPYEQVGITQNSTFGLSLGHVGRGKESTNDTLPYTWGGITFEGNFIDPQSPAQYMILFGNKVYSRNNVPMGNIEISGVVLDQRHQPLQGVQVHLGEKESSTDGEGKYKFMDVDPNQNATLEFTKDGYKSYQKNVSSMELRAALTGTYNLKTSLISLTDIVKTTLSGVVKNPAEGIIADAVVEVNGTSTKTDAKGEFNLEITADNDLVIKVQKESYRSSETSLVYEDLSIGEVTPLGDIALYSPSSEIQFGGARGITQCNAEVYRGFDGIHFEFKTKAAITGGDRIELFLDTKTSFHGRDTTDYLIALNGDGGITITNYGNGTNTSVTNSGITNKSYLEGETYFIHAMIPYHFMDVSSSEIIGFSCGVYSERLHDWDGWSFEGAGFAPYVAPEFTDQYCRIGLDNSLYRALNNQTMVTKIYGKVVDANGSPIVNAKVNNVQVNENGEYSLIFVQGQDAVLTVTADGYLQQVITIAKEQLTDTAVRKDITLSKAVAVITGTCNVNNVKVYYREDPTIFTYVQNGTYSIEVPTSNNAHIVFELEGYQTVTKAIGKNALIQSAESQTPFVYNCTMTSL